MKAVLPKLQELYKTRMEANAKREKEAGAAYLAKAAAEKGATKTASGLVYRETQGRHRRRAQAEDVVKVHYEGKFVYGKVFDSSVERKEPASFPLNGVIPCWTEGVGMMKVGGKAQLVCPPDLAYGDEGRPPQMPGGATLVFEVELLEIEKAAGRCRSRAADAAHRCASKDRAVRGTICWSADAGRIARRQADWRKTQGVRN